MNKEIVRIRYDGPALEGHSIDVNHLAPALLALGDLCTLANKQFNGDKAAVKVMVRANMEARCFEFDIELVQTIFEQVKSIINTDNVKSAKDILSWLGIIAGVPGAVGLFKLLKWLKGRVITEKNIVKQSGRNVVEIKVSGSNNAVYVYPETAKLIEEPNAIQSVQKIVAPLT